MGERDTIHRLYLGRIEPRKRGMYKGTNFAEATERFRQDRRWLRKTLKDEETHSRFNRLLRDHYLIVRTEAREGFRKGFRLGAMLMIDVFQGESDVFYDAE